MNGEKWRFRGKSGKPENPEPGSGKGSGPGIPPPNRLPIWNILMMLILLWIWQDAVTNYTVKTLPYSEFKEHVRKGEVIEATVSPDRIQGKIKLTSSGTNTAPTLATNKPTRSDPDGDPNTFLFRTTPIEDPDLVKELEQAGVKFTGLRPSFLSQFIFAWILPIVAMVLIWTFIFPQDWSGRAIAAQHREEQGAHCCG